MLIQPGEEHTDGFCDASQAAIEAVVYMRVTCSDLSISTELVIAMSRVIPLKPQTIPRLELSAAILLTKLMSSAQAQLKIDSSAIFTWSDSMAVLGWIRTSPIKLKTHVANWVVQITNGVPPAQWRHIATSMNLADIASRGTTVSDLLIHRLWWHRPDWLLSPLSEWPVHQCLETLKLPDLKDFAVTITAEAILKEQILIRFSYFLKCINVLSLIIRFISNCRKKDGSRNFDLYLSLGEILSTEIRLFLHHQQEYFPAEIQTLSSSKLLPVSNRLSSFSPFIDKAGLMRVGGHLQQANLPY